MAERRPAPWYRTFAADDLASSSWYGLTLAERGLLDSLARLTWIDGGAPDDLRLLALAARASEGDVCAALTDAVRAHLAPGPTPGTIAVAEIVRQRAEVAEARAKMAAGGRKGRAERVANANATPKASHEVPRKVARKVARDTHATRPAGSERAPEMQCNAMTSTPSSGTRAWVNDYATAEAKT